MRFSLFAVAFLAAVLTGCVSAKNYRGLIPDKDARFRGVEITITTPWGSQRMTIDEIDTRLSPSTNTLPGLPVPQP